MTALLYILIVLIWGTTWYPLKLQIGEVHAFVSVFYRFAMAGLLMLPVLLILRRIQPTKAIDHAWFALQGACLFCFNFVCFYLAAPFMPSGLLSVIFSLAIFFNTFNNRLFWGVRPDSNIYLGAALGVIGLLLLFWPEISSATASASLLTGIGLGVLGTLFFSLGNMISIRHSKHGIEPLTSVAYGMNYGALVLLVVILISGIPFSWDSRPQYSLSLIYLAIGGSIIAFNTYLVLLNRIGASKAAYTTVMFPVVALLISWLFEDYHWNALNLSGLACVLLGNVVALGLFKKSRA